MTTRNNENKKRKGEASRSLNAGQMLFCVMSAAALILTFRYSSVAISSMSTGMKLCVTTVIPSLFPFMVLSELFVSSGAAELLGRLVGKPISRLFGVSRAASAAVLLGFICGFPIGTKSAISLYERGAISQGELEHLCAFCNIPSSAFLISAVGSTLFGSQTFGILLYTSHILSACIVGFAARFYFKKRKKEPARSISTVKRPRGFIEAFTSAVTGSASSMLFICAFVIFFSAVLGYLRIFTERVGMPQQISVLLFGFFEMTGGVAAASALPLSIAIPCTAVITGWSGLSVHFQLVGICREHRLSLRPYFVSKLACACLNAFIISILVKMFASRLSFDTVGSISSLIVNTYSPSGLAVLSIFFSACIVRCNRRNCNT